MAEKRALCDWMGKTASASWGVPTERHFLAKAVKSQNQRVWRERRVANAPYVMVEKG
jgi:hypothetical protein